MKKRKTGHVCLKRLLLALYIPYAVNIPLAAYVWAGGIWPPEEALGPAVRTGLLAVGLACTWAVWMAYSIMPQKKDSFASWRVTIMEGGRSLCYSALYGFAAQSAVLLWLYPQAARAVHDRRVLWINGIYSGIMLFILLWNGILRIFFTSVRLRLKYRILMLLAMWIPGLNLGVLLCVMRIVHGEYDFACYKESVRQVRDVYKRQDVARFNFSHGDYNEHQGRLELLKEVRKELDIPVAALLDTKGPEIRTGQLKDGKKVTLKEGQTYTLTTSCLLYTSLAVLRKYSSRAIPALHSLAVDFLEPRCSALKLLL